MSRYCEKCREENKQISIEKKRLYKLVNKGKIESQQKIYRNENKDKKREYNKDNKERIKEKQKEYRIIYKDKIRERRKEYRIKNKENINKYRREKMISDPLYKLSTLIRNLIKQSFRKKSMKFSERTFEILGCSFVEFKLYLENKFNDKMNWSNQGTYWHIDHIIPISWAKCEEDVYLLNKYTNFQPLSASENLSKNNRFSG